MAQIQVDEKELNDMMDVSISYVEAIEKLYWIALPHQGESNWDAVLAIITEVGLSGGLVAQKYLDDEDPV